VACHAVFLHQDEFSGLPLLSRLVGASTGSALFLQDDQLAVGLSSKENLLNALSNSVQSDRTDDCVMYADINPYIIALAASYQKSGISIVLGIIRCLSKINLVKNGTSRLDEVPYFLDIGYT